MTTAVRTYTEVAVPLDFSADGWRVVPLAELLARAFAVPVRFLHIDTSSPWSDDGPTMLALQHPSARRPVEVQVVPDQDVALGIARATTGSQSIVVMAAHARVAAAEVFMQNHLERILRSVDGSVVVGGPHLQTHRPKLSRIVLCLDADAPPVELLDDVVAWSRALSLPVEVLTVLPAAHGEAEDDAREQESRVALLAEELAKELIDCTPKVLRGTRPAHEIVHHVNARPGTVVALTTHARSVPVRAVLGSVALKVVRQATGPVLLRRREGF